MSHFYLQHTKNNQKSHFPFFLFFCLWGKTRHMACTTTYMIIITGSIGVDNVKSILYLLSLSIKFSSSHLFSSSCVRKCNSRRFGCGWFRKSSVQAMVPPLYLIILHTHY